MAVDDPRPVGEPDIVANGVGTNPAARVFNRFLASFRPWPARKKKSVGVRKSDTLFIPPPADGVTYTAGEVAEMFGYKVSGVKDLIARGRLVDGERLYLRPLRIPRGRISPGELCSFLGAVNGIRVEVADRLDSFGPDPRKKEDA